MGRYCEELPHRLCFPHCGSSPPSFFEQKTIEEEHCTQHCTASHLPSLSSVWYIVLLLFDIYGLPPSFRNIVHVKDILGGS